MATTKYLRQTLLLFVAVIVGALCWKVGIRTWQAALKWQPDPSAKLFLSKSLVSVHADLVLRTMTDTAQFPNFPEELAAAYEQSRQEIEPYALLGFNPDTIFYKTQVFSNLHGTVDETHRFLMNRYFGALKNAPFAMMTKWLRQLGIALFPEKKWIFRDSYPLRRVYERSAAELRLRAEIESAYPGAAGKAAAEALRAEAVAETMPPRTNITWKIGGAVLEAIRVLIPLGILLSLVSGCVAVLSPKLPSRACAIEAFFWCATLLGAVAAVAIVHSFDIDRYGEILTFLYLLMACYAAVAIGWLAEQFVQKIRTSKRLPKL